MKTKLLLILLIAGFTVSAQKGTRTIDATFDFIRTMHYVSYFEVTKDMFQSISESKNLKPDLKEYITKISKLVMIEAQKDKDNKKPDLYLIFLNSANLKGFSRLMTSEEPNERFTYFKKKNDNGNEFLLISTNTVIYLAGTIDIKTISEIYKAMEIAGSAFKM